ncbi:helix-turn-helix domain-containing protein [Pedobacter vanadiisoli]|uniref:Helix-turn-helix domain-containing protein n=1 Tax=Pedobacter vanadiisoli TaxID=1761975 RepID=A0ABW5MEI9_9SPHI
MDNVKKDTIAKLIKEARLKKGYSQQQLADLAKLNLRSVQRIENAEVIPRTFNLNLLAQQLELDVEALQVLNKRFTETPIAVPQVEAKPVINKPRKLILSVTIGVLTILFTAAFLSQSSRFPETDFELFLLMSLVIAINAVVLWRIWKF